MTFKRLLPDEAKKLPKAPESVARGILRFNLPQFAALRGGMRPEERCADLRQCTFAGHQLGTGWSSQNSQLRRTPRLWKSLAQGCSQEQAPAAAVWHLANKRNSVNMTISLWSSLTRHKWCSKSGSSCTYRDHARFIVEPRTRGLVAANHRLRESSRPASTCRRQPAKAPLISR